MTVKCLGFLREYGLWGFSSRSNFFLHQFWQKEPESLWHKLTPLALIYLSPMPWSFKSIYSRCNSFSQQHIPFETSKMAEAGKPGWCREQGMRSSFALDWQFSTSGVTEGLLPSALWCIFLGAFSGLHFAPHAVLMEQPLYQLALRMTWWCAPKARRLGRQKERSVETEENT